MEQLDWQDEREANDELQHRAPVAFSMMECNLKLRQLLMLRASL